MQPALSTTPSSGVPAFAKKPAKDGDEIESIKVKVKFAGGEDAKLPHAEVNYGPAAGADRCARCVHFVKDGPHCKLVEDPILASGWCDRFSAGAADAATALAFDRDTVRTVDADGRLHVAMTNISKAAINPYLGREIPNWEGLGLEPERIYQLLRDPEELAKAATTFNGVQVLQKHLPVDAEDHQPWDVVGATGNDAVFEEPFLKNSLVIWARDAIDGIESGDKKELSCGYRYRAEMTPGTFGGKRFDGVMREIVGNHIALVKDGRAGPEVVVGDSKEKVLMAKPTRLANIALQLTARAVKPVLAKDAKIDLMPIFKDITSKNFKAKEVALALDGALKGKLAKDANLEHVGQLLDSLQSLTEEKGADESVSEEQHKAMGAAASGESNLGIPKNVGEEFLKVDKGKSFDAEPIKAFLKEKGMSEDDIEHVAGMFPKPALDESPEEKAEREKKEAAAKDESEAEAKKKAEEEAKAKDEKEKDMVTKPAMDAAIAAASKVTADRVKKEMLETSSAIREAERAVRPYVGDLAMSFDSADQVYEQALKNIGVDIKGVHPSAYPAILKVQPKPGSQRAIKEPLGMDAAQVDSLNKLVPGLERIGHA